MQQRKASQSLNPNVKETQFGSLFWFLLGIYASMIDIPYVGNQSLAQAENVLRDEATKEKSGDDAIEKNRSGHDELYLLS